MGGSWYPWLHIEAVLPLLHTLSQCGAPTQTINMGKGFYISKAVGIVGIVLCAGALATIIALSVVYSQEKAKNNNQVLPTDGGLTTKPTVTPAPTSTPSSELWDKYRLPKSLVPLNYNVTLRPHLTPDPTTKLYIFEGKAL